MVHNQIDLQPFLWAGLIPRRSSCFLDHRPSAGSLWTLLGFQHALSHSLLFHINNTQKNKGVNIHSHEYEWSQAGFKDSCVNYCLSSLNNKYLACRKNSWLQLLTRWSIWSKWGQNKIFLTTFWGKLGRWFINQVFARRVWGEVWWIKRDLFPFV